LEESPRRQRVDSSVLIEDGMAINLWLHNDGNHLTILERTILNVQEIRCIEKLTTTNPDTASYPRRFETTATMLWEPQISQFITLLIGFNMT